MDIDKIKQAILKKMVTPVSTLDDGPSHPINANDIDSIKNAINENESHPIAKVAGVIQKFEPIRRLLGMPTKEESYGIPKGSEDVAEAATEPLVDFENKKAALQEFLKKKREDNIIKNAQRVRDLKDNPEVVEQHAPQSDEAQAAAQLRAFAKSL
jgi:hypothetical protein